MRSFGRLACLSLLTLVPWIGCDADDSTPDTSSSSSSTSQASSSSGATFCAPGETVPCYSGPSGTEGVGICSAGSQRCEDDGSAYSACSGEVLPSAENCASVEDEDCDGTAPACTGDFLGEQVLTGTVAEIYGLSFDSAGQLYATGIFTDTLDAGTQSLVSAGDTDLFALAFDADRAPIKSLRAGGPGHEEALSIAARPTSGFAITGRATENVDFATTVIGDPPYSTFVGMFSPSMSIRWARGLTGGPTTYVRQVAVNDGGRVAVVGYFEGTTIDVGDGVVTAAGRDAYVAVYDEQLASVVWSRIFSTPGTEQTEHVSMDASGNVFVSLYHSEPLTLDGLTATPGRSVVKLDATGTVEFIAEDVGATSVVADESGGVLYVSQGGLFALDAAGLPTWSRPGAFYELARDPFGNVVTIDTTAQATLVKLDPVGAPLFETPLDVLVVRALAVAGDGRIAIAGRPDPAVLLSSVQWFAP